ncbi:hypothetical protein E1B28_008664 [Marasmius oreades]|uniref:Sfi1 spindle body domain-containing protein n=1 Tax=Marasmius oreades TaxID=181124 RepID=A0A9P7RZI2_9AGAR|nr:uncharacterized protein E1B28_008664 [Marasmius oreades]KAG7092302.1 hypothetical protein E1B28_008664 [Marasmius oreades]
MFGFRPSRASPPARITPPADNTTPSLDVSRSSITATIPELAGLSSEDVELIEAIIERTGPNAAFLSVFKAYSDVLKERGLNSKEIFYYGKLLKLGTLKGGSWGEKWQMIKQQNRYDRSTRPGVGRMRGLSGDRAPCLPPPSTLAPSSHLTDDLFSSISQVHEHTDIAASQTSFDIGTEVAIQPLSSPFDARPLSSDLTDNTLGIHLHESPLLSAPPSLQLPLHGEQQHLTGRHLDFEPSVQSLSSTPPSYQSSVSKYRAAKSYMTQGRERRDNALNEEDAWNRVKVLQDEREADRFRDDSLLERSWDIWKQMYTWILTMNQQIGEARENLILRIYLQRWRERTASQREWCNRIAAVDNKRRLKAAFNIWKQRLQDRLQEKQKMAWRQDMRVRLATIRRHRKEALLKEYWIHWRRAYQYRLSEAHCCDRLRLRCYSQWKERLHRVYRSEDNADQAHRDALLGRFWEYWKRTIELRVPERVMNRQVELRVKREVFEVWKKQWVDHRIARAFYIRRLAKRMMKSWKSAKDRTTALECRADKHLARQDNILLRAVMRVWKARERGKLLEKVKAFRLVRSAWAVWKLQLHTLEEAQALAVRFSERLNCSTSKMAFQRWREVHASHLRSQAFVAQFNKAQLVRRMILRWRVALFKRLKMVKKARMAERYLLLRRFWATMKQKYREKIRLAKLQECERNKVKIFFDIWLHRSRKQRQIREAERIIQDRVRKRILHSSLQRWTIRVVDIKDRELRVAQEYHNRHRAVLLTSAFNHWKQIHTRHNEELRLMQSYQDIKREEMFKRIFYQWLTAARTRRHRRLVLQEKEEERKLVALSSAWEKWRERYMEARLQPLEYRLVISNAQRLKYQAFSSWQAKTDSLPAIKFHANHVKVKCWNIWLQQLPRAVQARKAREFESKSILKKFLDKWIQVHRTKLSLKAVARARYFPVSASKPSSRPAVHSRPLTGSAIPPTKATFPHRALRIENSDGDADPEAGPSEPLMRHLRPLTARSGLFPTRARTDPSPTRTVLSVPRTRESSPTRSTKSAAPAPWYSKNAPTRFPPTPSSVAGTEGRSTLWQELREVQRRSQSPSVLSRRSRPP